MIKSSMITRALAMPVMVATLMASPAQAQGIFDGMFGRSERPAEDLRSPSGPDPSVEMERLEQRLRQLTGEIERLQFRNRQLEQQLQAAGVQPAGQGGPASAQQMPPSSQPPMQPGQAAAPPPAPSQPGQPLRGPATASAPPAVIPAPVPGGGRGDSFDPARNPSAPGVPRSLGGMPAGSNAAPPPVDMPDDREIGAPGGRAAGAPLDLSTLSGNAASELPAPGLPQGGQLPPPPSRRLSATGAAPATQPPSDTPKDHYDLAYGYLLRKDYAQAEESFQGFLQKHPRDRLAGDANFWLGESLFQRQRYEAAAERFLDVSTKHAASTKAPDSLLRLGQSLAAMKQKEMACAAFAEVGRKYPRASGSVKQSVEREQKRVRC